MTPFFLRQDQQEDSERIGEQPKRQKEGMLSKNHKN